MSQSEYCHVEYNADLNIVLVTWKKFCMQNEYRTPLLHALDIMKQHPNCNYAADTRNGFENDESDTKWLLEEFLPQAAKTSCKDIFFIIDRDNTLKEELEGQSVQLGRLFDVHYCFDLDEIRSQLGGKS